MHPFLPFLRLWSALICLGTVTQVAAQAPANDDLCNATPLTIGASCSGTPNATNLNATYQTNESPATCFNAGAGTGTVWYSFIAPNSGNVRISTDIDVSGTNNDTEVALYALNNNDCSDLNNLVELACDQDGGTDVIYPGGFPNETYLSVLEFQGLTIGQTYYIQVGSYDAVDMGTFCIEIEELVTPPNDDLCAAQFLSVGASCAGLPNGDNASATLQTNEPIPDCSSGLTNTVWFQFTAPASGFVNITTDVAVGGTNSSSTIALYELPNFPGSCANLSNLCEVICANDNGDEGATIMGAPVTPGETYYVQVARGNPPSGSGGSFCLEISDAGPLTPPANDELCGAIDLTVGASSCNGTPNGSILYATQACDESAPPCFEGGLESVWYRFTAPANGVVSIYTNLDTAGATLYDSEIALYSLPGANCSDYSDLTLLNCNDDAGFGLIPANGSLLNQILLPGETYYIQVSGFESYVGDFCITVDSVVAPVNDDICDALPLEIDSTCNGMTNGENSLATMQSGEPTPGCFSGAVSSVWFTFVAPASGEVIISTDVSTLGTNLDTEMAVYSLTGGNCADLSNLVELGCNQDVDVSQSDFLSTLTLDNLNPDSTYYVQVSGWQDTQGSFCIEVSEGSLLPDNDDICDAIALPVDGTVGQFSNEFATLDPAEESDLMSPPAGSGLDSYSWDDTTFHNTLWFTFVAPASSAVAIDLCNESGGGNTNFDTQVAVYAADSCSNLSHLTLLGANDDIRGGCDANSFFSSYLEVSCLTPGETYYLVVDGWDGETGEFAISLTEIPAAPPLQADIFSIEPECGTESNGIISVALSNGAVPYQFSWEDNSTLPYRDNLGPGTYTLTATDGCDTTVVETVTLGAVPTPTLTIEDQVACDTGSITLGRNVEVGDGSFNRQRRGLFFMTDGSNTDYLRTAGVGNPYNDTLITNISGKVFQAGDYPESLGYFLAVEQETNDLYRIQRQSGDTTRLFEIIPGAGESILGLAYDDKNERLLALGVEDFFFSGAHLYEVDLNLETTTEIVSLADAIPIWIAVDTSGIIYALDAAQGNIVTLNELNGTHTVVSELDFILEEALSDGDFDPSTNELYFGAIAAGGIPTFHHMDLNRGITFPLPGYDALGTAVGAMGIRSTNHRFSYEWTALDGAPAPGGGNIARPNVAISSGGIFDYQLTVRDGCGQEATDTLTVMISSGLAVNVSADSNSVAATVTGGIPPYTFVWSNGSTDSLLVNVPDGTYSVTTRDAAGCEVMSEELTLTGLLATTSLHYLHVYPNPNEGRFTLAIGQQQSEPLEIKITDAQGRELKHLHLSPAREHQIPLDLSSSAKGLYLLQVISPHGIATRRLMVE